MNLRDLPKKLFYLFFPKLRLFQTVYKHSRKINNNIFNQKKMKLSVKILIGSGVTLFVIIAFGFIGFPKLIRSQIKKVSDTPIH